MLHIQNYFILKLMQPCQYIFALRAHHVHYSLKEEIQYLLPNRMVIFFENFITEQD